MNFKLLFCLIFMLFLGKINSQVTFVLPATACAGETINLAANIGTNSALAYSWAATPTGPLFSSSTTSNTTLSFPGPGTFTIGVGVLFTSGYGYTTSVINVLPAPNIVVTASSPSTCTQSNFPKFTKSVTLTAIGANTFSWAPFTIPPVPDLGIRNISPSVTTCYTVTGSDGTCTAISVVCVTVIPQFSFAVDPPSGIRCIPDSLKLSIINIQSTAFGPSSAFSYSWRESNGPPISMSSYSTASVIVFPLTLTTYTAEVRDAQNCMSLPAIVTVTVADCTGLGENQEHINHFLVYPNPFTQSIRMTYLPASQENLRKLITLKISNLLGQKVYEASAIELEKELDLGFLEKGIYFITVVTNAAEAVTQIKIIKAF